MNAGEEPEAPARRGLSASGLLPLSLLLFLLCPGGSPAVETPAAAKLPLLTSVRQIRELTPEQAALGYPLRLRAVVTYFDPYEMLVQDPTGGIYVKSEHSGIQTEAGQLVLLEGVSGPGYFAPEVLHPRAQNLGKTSLPVPLQVSLQELLSGQADSQWIEVEGVVHSVAEDEDGEHLWINLATGLWRLKAYVPGVRPAQAAQLVDAKVRVRGAGGSIHNQKRQLIGLQLYVPNAQQVVVEEPAAPDPFSLPLRPCNSLLRFRPQGIEVHRVRVHGAVTLQHAGRSLYIRDKTDGLYVVTAQTTPVQLGDEVDVAGFPALGEYAPVLEDAIFRRTASGPLPLPVEVTAEAARGGNYDAELVRIEGRLVESEIRGAYESLLIQVGNVFFNADLLMDQARGRLMALQRGSRLRLTAVCSIEVDANRVPQGFRLYLRSPEDVVVLERPPLVDDLAHARVAGADGEPHPGGPRLGGRPPAAGA